MAISTTRLHSLSDFDIFSTMKTLLHDNSPERVLVPLEKRFLISYSMTKLFYVGVFLTFTLFFSLFLLHISYLLPVGIAIHYYYFPFSAVFSLLFVLYLMFKKQSETKEYCLFVKDNWIVLLSCVSALVVPIIISTLVYDSSWDGQAYHQPTIFMLKEGWNPLSHFHAPRQLTISKIVNHYPHSIESLESIVYAFTNNLESSKAINMVLLFIAFIFSKSALDLFEDKLSAPKRYIYAAFLSLSPVAVPQLTSFYIDGAWYLLLLSIVGLLVTLQRFTNDLLLRFSLIGMLIALIIPAKINAFFFCGCAIVLYSIWLFFAKDYNSLKRLIVASTLGLVIGFFFFGFHPYISNIIDHQHPFYPLVNPNGESWDVMTAQTPKQFLCESRLFNVLSSYFNIDKQIETNTYCFRSNMSGVDCRIGGFGILFGLILVIGCFLFLYTLVRRRYFNQGIIFLLVFLLIGVFVFKNGWWPRFVPFFWSFPVLMILYWELGTEKNAGTKYIALILYVIVSANIFLTFNPIRESMKYTKYMKEELNEITKSGRGIYVDFGNNIGLEDKLKGANIPYVCRKFSMTNAVKMDSIGNIPYPFSTKWQYIE